MRHLRRRNSPLTKNSFLTMSSAAALIAASVTIAAPCVCRRCKPRKKWIDSEFQPSTLSKADQLKELQWFEKAAQPFKGMEINVVSETITTHEYESRTLAKAFTELTGIKVKHDVIQEGDVVEKLQTQMQSGKNVYDGWINDSDLIGTHFPVRPDHRAVRLHDRRRQGGHRSPARRQRLHRQVLHHGAGWKAVSASRPAVRQPVLVPLRLVLQSRLQGQVQGQIWLRARRSRELVSL